MKRVFECGEVAAKTIIIVVAIITAVVVGVYSYYEVMDNVYAEEIINDAWHRADQRKTNMDLKESAIEGEEIEYIQENDIGHRGYGFVVREGSTPSVIIVDTVKRTVSYGVCKALKSKFSKMQWIGVFDKVMVVDRLGNEMTNIQEQNCPIETIMSLRFYVRFASETMEKDPSLESEEETEEDIQDETTSEEIKTEPVSGTVPVVSSMPSKSNYVPKITAPARAPVPAPARVSVPQPKSSCPSGTSLSGSGAMAIHGCRCNRSDETWNGKFCVKKCPANKVFDTDEGKCVCPGSMVPKRGSSDRCVECNDSSDCFLDNKCIKNKCVSPSGDADDCRWSVCQTCELDGSHTNLLGRQDCDAVGLKGKCNDNGSCYPVGGRRCNAAKGCSSGEFCNYGGEYDSTKKQKGRFGKTPNVCQQVNAQEFTYKGTTYYYNTRADLQSWCRAANNQANCTWGYLAKPGAESWCISLGKRLLTKDEMESVWSVLKKELPKTFTGYAYWVQEGAWLESNNGKRSFSYGHPDGYGGKGGVVCR